MSQSDITVFGVGEIPRPPDDAPPQQWLDYAVVVASLVASDVTASSPTKEVGRAYLAKWPSPAPAGEP